MQISFRFYMEPNVCTVRYCMILRFAHDLSLSVKFVGYRLSAIYRPTRTLKQMVERRAEATVKAARFPQSLPLSARKWA